VDPQYREEVLNVFLALLLQEQGIVSAPEQALRDALEQRRRLPDILVDFSGLTVAIEGKVEGEPGASSTVLQQAQQRLEQGIGHLAVAVLYPSAIRSAPFRDLKEILASAKIKMAVVSEEGTSGWSEGDVQHLAELLRRTLEQLVREDVVGRAAGAVRAAVDSFAQAALRVPAVPERLADVLGIREVPRSGRPVGPASEEEEA
jgi:hypothetical protein